MEYIQHINLLSSKVLLSHLRSSLTQAMGVSQRKATQCMIG
ncbi:hypothetical protein Rleg4DRAFT_4356 [Rhizobium leguminosarum bv. trifolii WSM2297]|uniref:Uncharacterized protein n=1 Tax=Rhizobium leguminosarum bv. trifolii WSM2297 TaxID=754762 RepID=J0KXV7_RHILT|nr:hypothetical protein Rleg4DRAFT_4356 [Rhizobium leguminosarum bv. trifolii WSM2297]